MKMLKVAQLLFLSIICIIGINGINRCSVSKQDNSQSSFVCVCNATYCDEFPPLPSLLNDDLIVYTTSQASKRFDQTIVKFAHNSGPSNVTVTVDYSQRYQEIIGFGGAFTDATGISVTSLSQTAQQLWIDSYFGPNGIGYTLGRVPIASCDFSTREYSYDDFPEGYTADNYTDFELKNFSLVVEDYQYKIPLLKMAQERVGADLKLFASPWSAPSWMKTNDNMTGEGSTMKGGLYGDSRYWKTWSQYFVKFFEAYAQEDIRFWGLTVQNEPLNNASFQEMFMRADEQRDFLTKFLGPAIRTNPWTHHLKIMIWDYNRGSCGPYGPNEVIECGADKFLDVVLADQAASSYVDGIAMHWYDDVQYNYNVSMLDKIHEAHSNKWLLYTEACAGFFGGDKVPALGNWTRAEQYTHDIIEDLNHWSTGWTDWNMALDYHGGPNWDNNFVDSPIIVSQDNTSFYKQPMFYALGHFSKFILPGSIRIGSKIDGANSSLLEGVAFQNPQNQTVLVLHNREAEAYQVAVKDSCSGLESSVLVEPYSISTLVWKSSPTCYTPTSSGLWIMTNWMNTLSIFVILCLLVEMA